MKTQLRKPARERASYTKEYRREALELVAFQRPQRDEGGSGTGHSPPLLYRWAHWERESDVSKSEPKSRRNLEALEAEIRRYAPRTPSFWSSVKC